VRRRVGEYRAAEREAAAAAAAAAVHVQRRGHL